MIAIRTTTNTRHSPDHHARLPILVVIAMLLLAACSDGTAEEDSPLASIQLAGVDFPLDSVLLINNGAEVVRTENLHLCQGDMCFEFNIFSIQPRATILFSVSRAGGVVPEMGEIALFDSDAFDDPESMVDYVAWGSAGQSLAGIASEALLWSEEDYVESPSGSIVLTRIDPAAPGSEAWEASDEIP